jgi:hypothetical protein
VALVGTVDSLSIALRAFKSLRVQDQIREIRILVDHRDVQRQINRYGEMIVFGSRLVSLLHMMRSLSGLRHIYVSPYGHACGTEQDIGMALRRAFEFGVEGKQLLPKVQFHVTSQEDEKTVSV